MSWREALRAAAEHDLDEGSEREAPRARKLLATVSAVAFSLLLLELLLTRMFPFFLGDVSSFVAIPVAMYGLSVGAVALHLDPRPATLRAIPVLLPLLALTTLGSFLALFLLFDHGLGLTHHQLQSPPHDALKTAVFSLLFVPPFALGGVILSTAFARGASSVGALYAADLAGSALACVVAPVALHLFDLPVVICLPLWALWLAALVVFSRARGRVLAAGAGLAVLTGLACRQLVFVEHPDPAVMGVRYADRDTTVAEHVHRWNDLSRVALLSWERPGAPTTWRLLHDDGVSNVVVIPWDPGGGRDPTVDPVHGLPFLLDRPPSTALVLFAGAGRDLVRLRQKASGPLEVTGVEINGLVPELATAGGDPFHLRAFYDLPDVHLVVQEGRSFLDADRHTYDLVFAGSNGAETAVRTGHVRKFLDTTEAVAATLDHLAPDGLVVYYVQPFGQKLEILKRLFAERGLGRLEDRAICLGSRPEPHVDGTDTLLVKPAGFSRDEAKRITDAAIAAGLYVHCAPGPVRRPLAHAVGDPIDPLRAVPTDDRPYERELSLAGFTPFPNPKRFDSLAYCLDWMKLFTLLLFLAVSTVTVAVVVARPRAGKRLPAWAAGWFLGTGVCYMLTEIGLMAKLELFMGSPLLSTAVVLAAYLLANAAGSAWVGWRRSKGGVVPPALPPALAMVAVPLTLLVVDGVLVHQLGLPVGLKAVLALATTAPLAAVLGTFYPVGVGLLADRGLEDLVPTSFGFATLSSVVGSTFALVAMIDVGARAVVLWAALGYALVAVAAGAAGLVRSR